MTPSPAVTHLPATATGEEVGAVLDRDGVAVVDSLVPGEVFDRIEAELAGHLEATPYGPEDFTGLQTKRTGALIARSPAARELVMNPLVLSSVGTVLAHATAFRLHLTQVIAIGPGETPQYIHRDQWAFDFFPFPTGFHAQCNTLWAMTDFTEENGATRVIPGSHLLEDRLRFGNGDTIPAEMSRGSVLLYVGGLYHGGGANQSAMVRKGVNITYAAAWLRQEENQYLSTPPEIARELPDDLLKLMGYAKGSFALGYIDDIRDPMEAIKPSGRPHGFAPDPA